MDNFQIIKCPYCGASDGIKKHDNIYKCGYCDCEFFVMDNETRIILEDAHNDLARYKFDDADDLYRKLSRIAEDSDDNELYVTAEWGRLLAYFGVVYVKSFKKGALAIPTFAKYSNRYNSVKECDNYKNIMDSKASDTIKKTYEEMASKLDETYSRIGEELKKISEYDVFICTKISTATEHHPDYIGYTEDSQIANEIYDELTRRGVKVFYSAKSCQGIEFDSQILSALSRSKMLLIISTQREYLESAWVQSEWRRWLNFIKWEDKKKNSLILYTPNSDMELPTVLTKKKIQFFDSEIKVVNHIVDTIEFMEKETKSVDKNEFDALLKKIKELEEFKNNINNQPKEIIREIIREPVKEEPLKVDPIKLEVEPKKEELVKSIEEPVKEEPVKEESVKEEPIKLVEDSIESKLLKEAKHFYELRKYARAIEIYNKPELIDSSEAHIYLGFCFKFGRGVEKNIKKALFHFEVAEQKGSIEAKYYIGDLLLKGKPTKPAINKAIKKLNEAYENESVDAAKLLYKLYKDNRHVEHNYSLALKYLDFAINKGDKEAIMISIEHYSVGFIVLRNENTACNLIEKLNFDSDKLTEIGCYYFEGIKSFKKSPETGLNYLKTAIKMGNIEAEAKLGYYYGEGVGLKQDYTKAIELFTKAANKNNAFAQYYLGLYNEKGYGVKINLQKAREWYQKSANQGFVKAEKALGNCYAMGIGTSKNPKKAIEWYEKAANSGDVDSQFFLGSTYECGYYIKDKALAAKYYKMAASNGHLGAINALKKIKFLFLR